MVALLRDELMLLTARKMLERDRAPSSVQLVCVDGTFAGVSHYMSGAPRQGYAKCGGSASDSSAGRSGGETSSRLGRGPASIADAGWLAVWRDDCSESPPERCKPGNGR